jgi:hypothetical protein
MARILAKVSLKILEKALEYESFQGAGSVNKMLNFLAWDLRTNIDVNRSKYRRYWYSLYDWYCRYFKEFLNFASPEFSSYGGYGSGLPNGTASSLESIIVFSSLMEESNPVILNCGAGACSFVLRKLFRNVICCDPDEEYLICVKNTCAANGLSDNDFIVGLENAPQADYTFYDYGNVGTSDGGISTRKKYLPLVLTKTRVLLYADDADDRVVMRDYREFVRSFALMYGVSFEDATMAKDKYGRWGVILRT